MGERGSYKGWLVASGCEAAMGAADVEGKVRLFHYLRYASLTNGAAAGEAPISLMAGAGHASMRTTNVYLHLAGVVFRDEAERLEQRLPKAEPTGRKPA